MLHLFLNRVFEEEHFIFVDETTFSGRNYCKRRWFARKSKRYFRTRSNTKRLNLILGIDYYGVVCYNLSEENTSIQTFNKFICKLVDKIWQQQCKGMTDGCSSVIVFDNASYHRNIDTFKFLRNNGSPLELRRSKNAAFCGGSVIFLAYHLVLKYT